MANDQSWDYRTPAGRGRVLAVLRREIDEIIELAQAPGHWHDPTACEGWELRDMVGHLLDATTSYLSGFDLARRGMTGDEPIGTAGMAKASDEAARSFRGVSQRELVGRLRTESDRLLLEFERLSDTEWPGLLVHDRYLGPLPAMIVAMGLLGGSLVHAWDVREGRGGPHSVAGDAADLLVPFVFLLWGATADTSSVKQPFGIGIRTFGQNGGETKVEVSPQGVRFSDGEIGDSRATLEFDPGTLVLAAYGRINGGTVRGDPDRASRFRSLFISI